jgi:hypothetical protein
VTYRDRQRLADIQAAIEAIYSHLERGGLSDGLVFDAVRIRLLEIGEAVKAPPDELLSTQPVIPWRQIARKAADPWPARVQDPPIWRGGRVDAALSACRTDLRIMWRSLLVIGGSQVRQAAGYR